MPIRRRNLLAAAALPLAGVTGMGVTGAGAAPAPPTRALERGIEVEAGGLVLRVTALADAILRVQIAPGGRDFTDQSWAVLPEARTLPATIRRLGDRRFATAALEVTVSDSDLRLTIADLAGTIICDDAPGRPPVFHAGGFQICKASPADEHYYGLGDKSGALDRRGRALQMWNTDAFDWQESTDPLYKSVPFFLAFRQGRAWGLLLDNTWRSSFDFNVTHPDVVAFGAAAGTLDYYVLAGPDPKRVLAQYAQLTGTMPLPPLWALGFQQSRYSYVPQVRVLEVAAEYRARAIPLDTIYLDIGYQDRDRPFTTDPVGFPQFDAMIRDLHAARIRVVAITDLHIPTQAGPDYAPYATGAAGDHFLKAADGSVYVGRVWPGPCAFPDFTQSATREWWGGLYRDFYLRRGIDGFWNDMNEPAVFDVPTHTMPLDVQHRIEDPPRIATHAEIHNVYGMQNARATHDGLLALDPDRRPFVLTRASFAGGQRHAATWTGDNTSIWSHLRISVPQLLNLGLSGFALCGDDIGGFSGSPQPDLLTRWVQLGAFNPLFRDHTSLGTADQEMWVHGPVHEAIRRRAIEARYRLLPYLYTVAEEASRTGTPIMRPLFLEFPAHGWGGLESQFLFGPDLMVAPWPDETLDDYPLAIPAGSAWYDYWTGLKLDAEHGVRLRKRLDTLPVFARAGAIIAHQPLVQSTQDVPHGPLQLRVYPAATCAGTLYADDGHSFAYRGGAFLRQDFTGVADAGGITLRAGAAQGSFTPWWTEIDYLVLGQTRPPQAVLLDGQPIGGTVHDAAAASLRITIPASRNGSAVSIRV